MSLIQVQVCTGRSCTERFSDFIRKRLIADRDFYDYGEEVSIDTCLCQGRCQESPTVVYDNDVQTRQNPVKSSEILRKKVAEARKRLKDKSNV